MYRLIKATKKGVLGLVLTFSIFSGIIQFITSPSSWGDGYCQTLDEDDPPSQKSIEPEI
ncbi:MAG: hypothetical protein K2N63_09810 [Lachnospiraceae bacterium]|nr:hypothetical protein [Lachnospiraceae bacterium]